MLASLVFLKHRIGLCRQWGLTEAQMTAFPSIVLLHGAEACVCASASD